MTVDVDRDGARAAGRPSKRYRVAEQDTLLTFPPRRDDLLGISFTDDAGNEVKAGGRVVKNVAGYDLSRLMCGSFGSLAVVTSATFKLAPLPPVSRLREGSVR